MGPRWNNVSSRSGSIASGSLSAFGEGTGLRSFDVDVVSPGRSVAAAPLCRRIWLLERRCLSRDFTSFLQARRMVVLGSGCGGCGGKGERKVGEEGKGQGAAFAFTLAAVPTTRFEPKWDGRCLG